MKSTLLRVFLEWALITSVLMSVGFLAWVIFKEWDSRKCNQQLANAQAGIQRNRVVIGLLLAECQEYAKTNADMARFLNAPVPQSSPAPALPPATKPKAK